LTYTERVWVAGFEPATFCIQNRHATWLRYTQRFATLINEK
jgi:hypothetical protein